jgi:hypothetical protein
VKCGVASVGASVLKQKAQGEFCLIDVKVNASLFTHLT